MTIRSIYGPEGKVGSIATNGDVEQVYDRYGKKLGTTDSRGTRSVDGRRITSERMSGILLNRPGKKARKG